LRPLLSGPNLRPNHVPPSGFSYRGRGLFSSRGPRNPPKERPSFRQPPHPGIRGGPAQPGRHPSLGPSRPTVAQPSPRLHNSDLHRPTPGPSTTPPAPKSAGTGSPPSQASFEWKSRCHWRSGIRDDAEPGIEHGVFGGFGGPRVRECRGVQGGGVEDHGGRREG